MNEFMKILKDENVINHRVNGFLLSSCGDSFRISGRIPLSLARLMFSDANKEEAELQDCGADWYPDKTAISTELLMYTEVPGLSAELATKIRERFISQKEYAKELDTLYILQYYVATPERLKHFIHLVREGNYINDCLYDLAE